MTIILAFAIAAICFVLIFPQTTGYLMAFAGFMMIFGPDANPDLKTGAYWLIGIGLAIGIAGAHAENKRDQQAKLAKERADQEAKVVAWLASEADKRSDNRHPPISRY